MKKSTFFSRFSLLLLLGMVTFGLKAQELKPYPVYFPVTDYAEFNYGVNTSVARNTFTESMNMWWHSAAGWDATANCGSMAYQVVPGSNFIAAPYGKGGRLASGYNRAQFIQFQTPYLNPGEYRVYLGVSLASGTNRSSVLNTPKLNGDTLAWPKPDTTKRVLNGSAQGSAPNKVSVKFGGSGTVRYYDVMLGYATVDTAGRQTLSVNISNSGGTDYAYSMVQFIPVTENDLDSDYEYPKFDNAGNLFFEADSLKEINDTPVTGYYLPYQVADPSTYTKYSVTFNAGLYFANKRVVVKRGDDKWTRVAEGFADAQGKLLAEVPAGTYYVEVNDAIHTTEVTIEGAATVNVGVETGTVTVSYSPELWYVGKTFQITNAAATTVLNEFVIPATGLIPAFALPVNTEENYRYYVLNDDNSIFEEGEISVPNASDVTMDLTKVKFNVQVELGSDAYGANQGFYIYNAENDNALFVFAATSAAGSYATQLPNGNYRLASENGLLNTTFTVEDAAVSVDLTPRYSVSFCFGKTVAGAKAEVFLSSTAAKIGELVLDADGKGSVSGLTSGRYFHNVLKIAGTDTTVINPKFTFMIEGANLALGNCDNANAPYFMPYPVYWNVNDQPEITFHEGKSFQPGDLEFIKFDPVVTDTVYKTDTVWVTEDTYVINIDSTQVVEYTYWDYACTYWGGGISFDKSDNAYVWNEQFKIRIPKEGQVTFVTPNLNPGRYNVYISNRWAGGRESGMVETFMDGKPLYITDGRVRTFNSGSDWGSGQWDIMKTFSAHGKQQALFMGEAFVETTGRHELTLYSPDGATKSGDYGSAWYNMIYFVPVDVDTELPNGTFWPKIDMTGRLVYNADSLGNTTTYTTMGTDYVDKAKNIGQFQDPTVYKSEAVNYAANLTVNGGVFSRGDQLWTKSPVDNWTVKTVTADTITGVATVDLLPQTSGDYQWEMLTEGIVGKVNMASNQTITIPEEIPTKVNSYYDFTPGVDDPSFGQISFKTTVSTLNDLPYYYPITGVIVYELEGTILNTEGDTIYRAKNDSLNGVAPVYSFDFYEGEFAFGVTYTGNLTRLQSSTTTSMINSLKAPKSTLDVAVYPNPASEYVHVSLKKENSVAEYTIYNQLGQRVLSGNFEGQDANIQLRGMKQGLYMIRVKAGQDEFAHKLMVK